MSDSPIEVIIGVLQNAIQQRNLNTNSLANLTGIPRKDLKKMLTGKTPLTVEALMKIGETLELTPEFLANLNIEIPKQEEQEDSSIKIIDHVEATLELQPFGNHSEQLLKTGFALGTTMILILNTNRIQNSGVPKDVLRNYEPRMPIRLDAEYHNYNKPQYFSDGFELQLSFDALYKCWFHWDSIIQIIFLPEYEQDSEEDDSNDNDPDIQPGQHLRIIK